MEWGVLFQMSNSWTFGKAPHPSPLPEEREMEKAKRPEVLTSVNTALRAEAGFGS